MSRRSDDEDGTLDPEDRGPGEADAGRSGGLELLGQVAADPENDEKDPGFEHRGLKLLDSAERTASGLEERQIAPEDLQHLQGLLRVRQLCLDIPAPALHSTDLEVEAAPVHEVLLSLSAPRTLKLRTFSLPEKVRTHHIKAEPARPRLLHSLELIQRQPVRRQRILPAELSPALREALARALFKQYGKAAQQMLPQALFAHVPPELKDSLRLSSNGHSLGILVPKGFNVARASSGTWLVLLEDRVAPATETRRILLRL